VFEQTFKSIDNILYKDAGCTSELHYIEQSSWLVFLKSQAFNDAFADLGTLDQVQQVFVGYQRHLREHGDTLNLAGSNQ
jgi:hypothetical protein